MSEVRVQLKVIESDIHVHVSSCSTCESFSFQIAESFFVIRLICTAFDLLYLDLHYKQGLL